MDANRFGGEHREGSSLLEEETGYIRKWLGVEKRQVDAPPLVTCGHRDL